MSKFRIRYKPYQGVILTVYYANESVTLDFELINPNYWEYRYHFAWIQKAYAAYLPPFKLDDSIPF